MEKIVDSFAYSCFRQLSTYSSHHQHHQHHHHHHQDNLMSSLLSVITEACPTAQFEFEAWHQFKLELSILRCISVTCSKLPPLCKSMFPPFLHFHFCAIILNSFPPFLSGEYPFCQQRAGLLASRPASGREYFTSQTGPAT